MRNQERIAARLLVALHDSDAPGEMQEALKEQYSSAVAKLKWDELNRLGQLQTALDRIWPAKGSEK